VNELAIALNVAPVVISGFDVGSVKSNDGTTV
jgi:hypothetical protein